MSALPRAASAAATESFDALLASTLKQTQLVDAARLDRDEEFNGELGRKMGPRIPPSSRKVSDRAERLIVGFEVSGKGLYEQRYRHPVLPAGQSGPTIGIGYDLGWAEPGWVEEDWKEVLSPSEISILTKACGHHGPQARAMLPQLSGIDISWDKAMSQFSKTSLPRFTAEVLNVLPNSGKLSPDSLGAMVSLVYNRGASFRNTTARFLEMRQIRFEMVDEAYANVPPLIRKMKHLWTGEPKLAGVVARRELEAVMFEIGLAKQVGA